MAKGFLHIPCKDGEISLSVEAEGFALSVGSGMSGQPIVLAPDALRELEQGVADVMTYDTETKRMHVELPGGDLVSFRTISSGYELAVSSGMAGDGVSMSRQQARAFATGLAKFVKA